MRAGKLNRSVTIQSRSTVQDEAGQSVLTWSDVASVRAYVDDISGREYIAADAVQNSAQTKIVIRHRPGIVPAMRVICGADTYSIEAVLGQDRVSLLLMCSRTAS